MSASYANFIRGTEDFFSISTRWMRIICMGQYSTFWSIDICNCDVNIIIHVQTDMLRTHQVSKNTTRLYGMNKNEMWWTWPMFMLNRRLKMQKKIKFIWTNCWRWEKSSILAYLLLFFFFQSSVCLSSLTLHDNIFWQNHMSTFNCKRDVTISM